MSKVKIKKKVAVVEVVEKVTSKSSKGDKPKNKLVDTSVASKSNANIESSDINFKIGRTAMSKIVDLVTLALPPKDYGDATSGVQMVVDGKSLSVCVNSGEMFIKTVVKLQDSGVDGVVVPDGKILRSIVGGLKRMKNSIEFKVEGDTLRCSCGSDYNGVIAHHNSVLFYAPPTFEEIEALPTMSIPVKLIRRAIDEVSFSCSNDKALPELMGVYFDQSKDGMLIVGSDSNRISAIQYNAKIKSPKSVIISVQHLNLMKKVINEVGIEDTEVIDIYVDINNKNMVYFKSEETLVGFQTLGDKYFDEYKSFLIKKEDCAIQMKVNVEELFARLDLATSHNTSNMDVIHLLASGNTMTLKSAHDSSASNVNAFEIPVPLLNKVADVSISLVPKMLEDILGKIKTKDVFVCLLDAQHGPAIVYPDSNDKTGSYTHVFSLD